MMKTITITIYLLSLTVAPIMLVAQTQTDLNAQARTAFDNADAELNRVYSQLITRYASDSLFISTLQTAQRAWLIFRDSHLKSLFPLGNDAYGTVLPMCYFVELRQLTEQRTRQLNQWLEGIEKGDVCNGSRGSSTH